MEWNLQAIILGEVALAMALGALIGIERELADKPAGFRTQMLVAGAAALLVGLGEVMTLRGATATGAALRVDPIRIVEAIVTGVSFVGAGTIFRRSRSEQVQGLTTATSLLLSSAIGIAVALRLFLLALGVTVLALLVLRGLGKLEGWLEARGKL